MKRYLRCAIRSWAAFAALIMFDAQALTFTVNDTTDLVDDSLQDGICHTANNTCTLRAAVMQANVTGGVSVTIALPAGTFTLLRPVLGSDGDYEGDLNLQSPATTLFITGAGAGATVIDGNGLFRVFNIAAVHDVSVSGVTIRNGYTTGNGGGITAGAIGLSISGCAFDHNTAAAGGAIASVNNPLSVTDTQFSDNVATAGRGGAIYVWGSASVDIASATISHATFSGNSAASDGGGLASVLALVTVSDSVFTGNHADAGSAGALLIDNRYTDPFSRAASSAERITISGNTAVAGAGILLADAGLTLDASTISGNIATGNGGGLALLTNLGIGYDPASLTLTSSTIAGNMAHGSGGGVWGQGIVSLASSTIAFNVADSDANQSGDGGGIYNFGSLTLRNTLLAANTNAGSGAASDCASTGATLDVYGSNLFTSAASIASCAVTTQPGGNYGYVNDLATLLPLADNGGPTLTVGLKQGSNAIDAGDSLAGCVDENLQPLTTDQRGQARSVGQRCDIGAFEYGADSLFASGFESAGKLVINEVDYDQVGTDTAEFIEIRNDGPGAASLAGVALVLVNGTDGSEYARIDLSGATQLAAGAYLVVHSANVTVPQSAVSILFPGTTDQIQNGSPDGIALIQTSPPTLIDALSYEGTVAAAQIVGFSAPVSLVEGTPLAGSVADSNTLTGSLGRFPDGADSDDANTDWSFRATPTPGAANQ